MIGKIAPKGKGFRGLATYLLRQDRGRIVAGPMAGRTPRELAREFGALRKLNPRVTKAVAHLMLSPSSEDAPISDEQWQAIAQRYIEAMGFENSAWVAVLHQDTDHQHIHIIASRIDFSGKTVSDSNDFRRSEAIVRKIEQELHLRRLPSPASPKPFNRNANQPEEVQPLINSHQPGERPMNMTPTTLQQLTCAATCAEPLDDKARRELRRTLVEPTYEARMRDLLGEDFTRVHVAGSRATLYFKQPGSILDEGERFSVKGGMDERLAAQRVVLLGLDRGWSSITFTGSASFIERAMREAVRHRLSVVPRDRAQEVILARVLAEQGGAMGAQAGMAPGPSAASSVEPEISRILAELDDIPKEAPTQPRSDEPDHPADPPRHPAVEISAPQAPVLGVFPMHLNLRERLQARREQRSQEPSAPRPPSQGPRPRTP